MCDFLVYVPSAFMVRGGFKNYIAASHQGATEILAPILGSCHAVFLFTDNGPRKNDRCTNLSVSPSHLTLNKKANKHFSSKKAIN